MTPFPGALNPAQVPHKLHRARSGAAAAFTPASLSGLIGWGSGEHVLTSGGSAPSGGASLTGGKYDDQSDQNHDVTLNGSPVFRARGHKIRQISETVLDDTITAPDGISGADVTGNGLTDYLVAAEAGHVYWFEQTSAGSFTRHTIRGSSVTSAKIEGALWIQLTDDGTQQWVAVVADQGNGEIRAYKQDTPGTPTGTWTEGTIQTSRPNMQDLRAFDIDGDGEDEIVYSWEGSVAGEGGINWLDYDGTGSLTASGSYTDHVMVQRDGAWWIAPERKDLSGDGNATDIAFSARNQRNSSADPGIFWIEEPATVTNTWAESTIDSTAADWLHIDWGDFFGNGNADIVAHNISGDLVVYDSASAWAKTTILSNDQRRAAINAVAFTQQRNGRDRIISFGSGNVGTDTHGTMTIWQWDGSAWEIETEHDGVQAKQDDRILWSGDTAFYSIDSALDEFSRFDVSAAAVSGIGDAVEFPGADTYGDLPDNMGLSTASDFTLGAVASFNLFDPESRARPRIFGLYDGADDIFFFGVGNHETQNDDTTDAKPVLLRIGHIGGDEIDFVASTDNVPRWDRAHLTLTWDASANTATIYLNGTQIAQTSGTVDDPFDDAEVLDIARRSDDQQYFAGRLPHWYAYNRKLDDSEIQQLDAGLK